MVFDRIDDHIANANAWIASLSDLSKKLKDMGGDIVIERDIYSISRIISRIYKKRSRIADGLLAEFNVWRILNEIYVSTREGRRICVSDVAIATDIPQTTSLRWLALLGEKGLIERVPDASDRRRCWLELTPYGTRCLEESIDDFRELFSSPAS